MINNKYLKYLFTSKKIAWIFFLVMYMAVSLSSFITYSSGTYQFSLRCSFILSILMTFVLPIFLFSFVHRKRSCDLYFSLPVKRKDLLCTTIVFSFLIIFGYYLITTCISTILCFSRINITFGNLLINVAFVALSILVLLLINSAIYLFANNILDGVIMLLAYLCIPVAVVCLLDTICNILLIDFVWNEINLWTYLCPASIVINNGFYLMCYVVPSLDNAMTYMEPFSFFQTILLVIYACASIYLLKKHFIERKTERAEQISDTFLSYPFIINYYLLISLFYLGFSITHEGLSDIYIIAYLFLYFVYIIALFIYKRKIRFYWKNTLYYIIVMVVALVSGKVIYMNKGFGLPYTYPLSSGDTVSYSLNEYNLDTTLENVNDYDADTDVTVNVTFSIPTSDLNDRQYSSAISILEKTRKNAIDEWFKVSDVENYNYSTTSINISNLQNNSPIKYSPTYYTSQVLSIEDLKELDTCSTITINVYNYEKNINKDYSLTEYLKEVQNNDFE